MLRICLLIFLINSLYKNKISCIRYRDFSITLKIKGTGSKKVFCEYLYTQFYPDKIKINNEQQNSVSSNYVFQDSPNGYNIVELIWNNKINDSHNMFNGCSDIIEFDFSNFDTSQITYMNSMFRDCSSLTSLDLSKFDTSKVTCVEHMFSGCSKLKYINLEKFSENVIGSEHYNGMFYSVPNNVVVCINGEEDNILSALNYYTICQTLSCSTIGPNYNCVSKCTNLYYFDENNKYSCLAGTECPSNYNKFEPETKQCTNNCQKIVDYPYEFKKKCYRECPNDISVTQANSYLCKPKCTIERPLEIVAEQECTNFCGINDMEKNYCVSNYEDESIIGNLILKNIKSDILTTNFNRNTLINEQNIIIEKGNIKFTITTNKIQKNSSPKLINLGQCENILLSSYNLDDVNNIIIFIIDVPNKRQFEAYGYHIANPYNLIKLDLNYCDNYINNEISKCSLYSIESLSNDLCISCSNSYYPKYNEHLNTDPFKKCYKSPLGYYLDNGYYKECYSSCKECREEGNEINHNCVSCKREFFHEINKNNYINCYEICDNYEYYNTNNGKYYCTEEESCPQDFNKLIPERRKCVKDCSEVDQYEFRHICYHECPLNISEYSTTRNFFCEAKCPKELPFEFISTQECLEKCTIMERENGLCKINYISNDENDKEVEDKAIENIQEELTDNFDTSSIDNGTNIIIKQKDSTITITTTDNQKNENSNNATTINLGECENKIKAAYNIPSDKPLYILKIEVKQNGLKIPKTEYEVYYPLFGESLIKLNLTACENLKIDLSIPVKLSDDIKKMNSSSEYYNDICYTYTSEDGTDMSLSDRQKQFVNNNLTLCEENCVFTDYDYSLEKAVCSCKVKTNSTFKIGDIVIDTNKLYDSFTNIKNIANINVLKCYKLMFKLEAYKSNYANLVLIFIIFLFFLSMIIFFCKDYFDLLKILHMIVFFKLNPKLVKKFLERLQKEQNKKNKKIIKKNININILAPKKISFDKSNYYVINGVIIKRPIFSKDYNKMERELIKNNPVKKKLKIKKNMIESTSKILNILQTNNLQKKYIRAKPSEKDGLNENEMYKIFLKINNFTYTELNQLKYLEAIKLDKRTYLQYYISLVCTNHILVFSFISKFDYNSKILKQFLFFFNFTVNFTVNALFFNDETMHKIYTDKGSFNFIYNIPQILYSSLITGFIIALIQTLALTDSYLINLKHYKDKRSVINKEKEVKKILIIKFVLFFFVCLILLIIFWFYLACFCSVYKNTQLHLIKDTLISFGTSMIYPLFIYLVPGIFRIIAINSKKRNKECMFKFSKLLQLL